MDAFAAPLAHLLWIIPLVLLIAYLGSPRCTGTIGQTRTRRLLSTALEKNLYTVLNDFSLPAGGGTAKLDHVVVSQFGIFVIQSIHRRGWISAGEFQDRWKQSSMGRASRFDNPVHQNILRVQVLERLLDLPRSRFHSIVVFSGQKGFKSGKPPGVVETPKLVSLIRARREKLLSPEQANGVLKTILNARLKHRMDIFTDPWKWLRIVLVIGLSTGIFYVYSSDIKQAIAEIERKAEMRSSPDRFHPDGRPKNEQEIWEDSLLCSYSDDTGRCSCYEPKGEKVDIGAEKCQSLAERGSILRQ